MVNMGSSEPKSSADKIIARKTPMLEKGDIVDDHKEPEIDKEVSVRKSGGHTEDFDENL